MPGSPVSVSQHIIEALSSHPVGTFLSVAEIAGAVTSESQRAGRAPSASAISARLSFTAGIPGVTPGNKIDGDESSPQGARRSA